MHIALATTSLASSSYVTTAVPVVDINICTGLHSESRTKLYSFYHGTDCDKKPSIMKDLSPWVHEFFITGVDLLQQQKDATKMK